MNQAFSIYAETADSYNAKSGGALKVSISELKDRTWNTGNVFIFTRDGVEIVYVTRDDLKNIIGNDVRWLPSQGKLGRVLLFRWTHADVREMVNHHHGYPAHNKTMKQVKERNAKIIEWLDGLLK